MCVESVPGLQCNWFARFDFQCRRNRLVPAVMALARLRRKWPQRIDFDPPLLDHGSPPSCERRDPLPAYDHVRYLGSVSFAFGRRTSYSSE